MRLDERDWLQRSYVDEKRSSTDIAAELGCDPRTVLRACHLHGLPVRAGRLPRHPLWDAELIRRLYCTEGRSLDDIARRCGCSSSLVHRIVHAHDLPVRSHAEAQRQRRARERQQQEEEQRQREAKAEELRAWLAGERARMNGAPPPEVVRGLLEAARARGERFSAVYGPAVEAATTDIMFARMWKEVLGAPAIERQWRLSYLRVGPRLRFDPTLNGR
jgi:hypothetical protein